MKYPYNLDYSQRLVVELGKSENQILEKESEDGGAITAIETYAPGSGFTQSLTAGEELLVLEGEFFDKLGSYPAGTYVRNTSDYSYSAKTEIGCKLFVKRNYFKHPSERIVIDTTTEPWREGHGGLKVMPLAGSVEGTSLVKWPKDEKFLPHRHMGGEEILVLSGTFIDENGEYPKHTWVRSPHLSTHHPYVNEETVILVKVGHLLSE